MRIIIVFYANVKKYENNYNGNGLYMGIKKNNKNKNSDKK